MAVGAGGCGQILLAEPDSSARVEMAATLKSSGFDVVEVNTGARALDAASRCRPVVVVLDVRLPGICGYEVCRALREEYGDALGIILTSADRTDHVDRIAGLLIGADECVAKPVERDELAVRVRVLVRRTARAQTNGDGALTSRELDVLRLLAEGLDQHLISERLVISPKTVAGHIERILGKLGAHSRAQAVALAYRQQLVSS